MSISSVAAAQSAQTVAQSASDKAAASLSENYTMFLTLLTTQLKNQNPLDPMKSETFTQQLVQMSSVEQSIQTNKNLETLISASAFQAANTAVDITSSNPVITVNGTQVKYSDVTSIANPS